MLIEGDAGVLSPLGVFVLLAAPSRPRRVGAGTCPCLNLAAFFLLGIFERSMQHSFFGVVLFDFGGSDLGLWCVLAQSPAQLVLAHLGPVVLTLP